MSHIAERPLFGLGYQAFWVQTNASAEALWRMFGIAGRGGFNFHNTYISNAVEIGIVGVTLQVAVLYGALIGAGIWALRSHRAEAAGLFALVLMVTASSFIEVPVFFQFSISTVNIVCILVFAIRAVTERHAPPVRPEQAPTARHGVP
jgi:exopolysaccharide production protein ExoQ